MNKRLTWSYIAGFFDGEGCVYWTKQPYGRYALLHVSQAGPNGHELLHEIRVFLAEQNIRSRVRRAEGKKSIKPYWKLLSSDAHSVALWLRGMLPYLRIKRQQAESALAFTGDFACPRIGPLEERHIIQLRQAGHTSNEIAKELGRPRSTINRWLRKVGLSLGSKEAVRAFRKQRRQLL